MFMQRICSSSPMPMSAVESSLPPAQAPNLAHLRLQAHVYAHCEFSDLAVANNYLSIAAITPQRAPENGNCRCSKLHVCVRLLRYLVLTFRTRRNWSNCFLPDRPFPWKLCATLHLQQHLTVASCIMLQLRGWRAAKLR